METRANGFRDGGRLSRLFVSALYSLSRIGALTDKGENCSFFFSLSFLSRWLIRREVYIIIIRMVRGAFSCHFKLTFKHDTMKLIFKFERVFSPSFFYEKFYHH